MRGKCSRPQPVQRRPQPARKAEGRRAATAAEEVAVVPFDQAARGAPDRRVLRGHQAEDRGTPTRRAAPSSARTRGANSGLSPSSPRKMARPRPRARRAIPRPAGLPRRAPDRGSTGAAAARSRLEASSASSASSSRRWSARSSGEPVKPVANGSCRRPPCHAARRRAGEQGRQAGFVEPLDRPPGRALASVAPVAARPRRAG